LIYFSTGLTTQLGRNEGGKGGTISPAPNHCGGANSLRAVPNCCGGHRKVQTMSQVPSSVGYSSLHFLPKDLRFEHGYGGTKLASCSWRHLTLLRPCYPAKNKY